jgi:hypothetical protein
MRLSVNKEKKKMSEPMSPALHVVACPEARNVWSCANVQNCSLSCVFLYANHLDNCTRCVHHVCGDDADAHSTKSCADPHCRKAAACWLLKGDLIEAACRNSLKFDGYVFEKIAAQLETLFQLDFDQVSYLGTSLQRKRSDVAEGDEVVVRRCTHTAKNTAMLFEFLDIFKRFKREMATYGMQLDGGDLQGVLQTLTQQLKPSP